MHPVDFAPRSLIPSNSVVKGVTVGGPASIVLGYIAAVISTKHGIPLEVVNSGLGLVISGLIGFVSYRAKGGRRGESH